MSKAPVRIETSGLPSGRTLVSVRLDNPARSNSLNPESLDAFAEALATARTERASFVHLSAKGRNFSTGGDVGRFLSAFERGNAEDYARQVVGRLQAVIAELLRLPAIVVTTAQGAVTGGSAGLLFASDLVILTDDTFIQPYYREVGFAPDGGWCALLPELIGAHRALRIQLTNRRLSASDAETLGLADRVVCKADLDDAGRAVLDDLDRCADADALICAKTLTWDDARLRQMEIRLKAEAEMFYRRVALASTASGMVNFLGTKETSRV